MNTRRRNNQSGDPKAADQNPRSDEGANGQQSAAEQAVAALFDEEDMVVLGEREKDDEHAFDHPSTYADQPWIWIPRDTLGLSEMLVEELRAAGVSASNMGSVMDSKGVVEVLRGPPDQDWEGGEDA
jgi:hypothetical protein